MRKRWLLVGVAVLLAALTTTPALAIGTFGPVVEVLRPGCGYQPLEASVDAAVGADGTTRGFVSFGGACGDTIRYFEGHGDTWTTATSPYHGRVLSVAWDATGTYLLYVQPHPQWAGGNEVRITKRTSDGIFTGGRRLAQPVFAGAPDDAPPTGDVAASGGSWWAVWTNISDGGYNIDLFQAKTVGTDVGPRRLTYDRRFDWEPSIALRPGDSATLAWQREDPISRLPSSAIWVATSSDDARWSRSREFELARALPNAYHYSPDLTIAGIRTYLTWSNRGRIMQADNESDFFQAHTFLTPGLDPHVAVSGQRTFVAWAANVYPGPARSFAAEREGATWSGTYVSPVTGTPQVLVGATATGGKLTVLTLSALRLYARSQI